MFARLPALLKFAIVAFLAEFLFGAPAQQLYQWLFTKWEPTMPEYIPAGLFAGIGIGLVLALWYLRRDEPGWWRDFDLNQRLYENETISMRSIARACMGGDQIVPVKKIEFRKCKIIGPDTAAFFGNTTMVGNRFKNYGTLLQILEGTWGAGMVAFQECEFHDCIFDKVQPLLVPTLYTALQADAAQQQAQPQGQ